MDASLFDYKNRDQVHFSVTTKAFSLCQKMPYILSNLRDIYTSFHNTLPIAETDKRYVHTALDEFRTFPKIRAFRFSVHTEQPKPYENLYA